MLEFYNSIDVFLGTGELEGTPNPAFEAAACGKPLVCTRTGAIVDLIEQGKAGFITENYHNGEIRNTIEESVDAIQNLQKDDELLYEMGKNALLEVNKNWTWKERANEYRTLLGIETDGRE